MNTDELVFEKDGLWWFLDTLGECIGPFACKEIAVMAYLIEFGEVLVY